MREDRKADQSKSFHPPLWATVGMLLLILGFFSAGIWSIFELRNRTGRWGGAISLCIGLYLMSFLQFAVRVTEEEVRVRGLVQTSRYGLDDVEAVFPRAIYQGKFVTVPFTVVALRMRNDEELSLHVADSQIDSLIEAIEAARLRRMQRGPPV